VKLLGFVVDVLRIQRKRTWKGDGENFVFVITEGRFTNRHTLNPAPDDGNRLEKAWKSTGILPEQVQANLQAVENK
jgi:hypothetical protein